MALLSVRAPHLESPFKSSKAAVRIELYLNGPIHNALQPGLCDSLRFEGLQDRESLQFGGVLGGQESDSAGLAFAAEQVFVKG